MRASERKALTDETDGEIEMDLAEYLRRQVQSLVDEIEGAPIGEHEEGLFERALDVKVYSSICREYLGAKVFIAVGAPTVWVDTRSRKVVGVWGSVKVEKSYDEDDIRLDEAIEDLWGTP